jgi:hypothetical protein
MGRICGSAPYHVPESSFTMSASLGIDSVVARLTQATGVSEASLSSILLIISVVAIGGAGLGLIVVCVRALLARPKVQPWIDEALAPYDDLSAPPPPVQAVLPDAVLPALAALALAPVAPVPPPRAPLPSVHETPTAPGIAAVDIENSIPSRAETTAEIDAKSLSRLALASGMTEPKDDDQEPETQRSGAPPAKPSGQTGSFFGESSPIPLVSKRPEAVRSVEPTLQTRALLAPPELPASVRSSELLVAASVVEAEDSHPTLIGTDRDGRKSDPSSSGLVVTGPALGGRDFAGFQYGARRA